ncbi:unnamed protein product [Didymodactylos carnosus]|uniref:Uncharacterized protein n=1 Tax=Didymodactylos carnosus TaxID=1234261 RepID=A0A8S2IWQ9_9BILA|nr:unnamed protein product [Didymodactylos carnosus]CAF3764213.1 unnamed protein product [Didymodactylos carnosus]
MESCVKGFGKGLKVFIKELAKKKGISLDTLSHFKTGFDMWYNITQNVAYNEKKDQAAQLINRGIDAIMRMISSVKKGRDVKNENKQQFIVLRSDVEKFLAQQASTTNNNPVSNFNAPQERATDKNPKFIVAVRQQELRYLEKTYEDRYNAFRKLNDEVSDMIGRMVRLDSDEIQFKDILEVLHTAVKLLAEIKTNWNHLTIFFKTIAQEIALSVDSILAPVLDHAEGAISPIKEERDRKFLLAAIDRLGKQAVDESHLIFLLSRTYVDISSKYLMEKLADLSRLMFMKTKEEREVELNILKNEESKMEETVRELVAQRRRIFQEHLDKQQRELEKLNQQSADSDEDNQQMSDQDQDFLNTNV